MSAASLQLKAGATMLRIAAGDLLTFRGAEVLATVNHLILERGITGKVDLTPADSAEIDLASDAVSPLPSAGEIFTGDGLKYRVESVKRLGHVVRCRCKTFE